MKTKTLSELEQKVMNIIWESKVCTVRQVLERLNQDGHFAYTTIATIFRRLSEKELITRKDNGFIAHYKSIVSKKDYGKKITKTFLTNFFQSFGETAIASFAESIESLPSKNKKDLLKLLTEHEIE